MRRKAPDRDFRSLFPLKIGTGRRRANDNLTENEEYEKALMKKMKERFGPLGGSFYIPVIVVDNKKHKKM